MAFKVIQGHRGRYGKLSDPLSTRAIPERLRGVMTTRRYTNPRLPYLTLSIESPYATSY